MPGPPKDSIHGRIHAVRHKDKRKNIPTEELRDFVRDEENAPRKVLYPRDPDLDPQLVWKGKDEQDASPLEVPAVPIYIQEKIHPQAIIEGGKRRENGSGTFLGPHPTWKKIRKKVPDPFSLLFHYHLDTGLLLDLPGFGFTRRC